MSYLLDETSQAENWGIYNCFAGEERLITDSGLKTFGEVVGTTQIVLNGEGRWVKAEIREFGVQSLAEITLRPGVRSNTRVRRRVLATPDHRWITTNRGEVVDLRKGDMIAFVGAPETDVLLEAWVAGFGFGDGTITRQGEAAIRLCGPKSAHLSRFTDAAPCGVYHPPSNDGDPTVIFHRGYFSDWKQLPVTSDLAWLASWLRGYLAADGSTSDGRIRLSSQDADAIEFAQQIAPYAGYMVTGLTTSSVMETNFGPRANPLQELMLRTNGEFRVMDVQILDVQEPVYCAVVDDGADFVLASGIRTGNCRTVVGGSTTSAHGEGRALDIGMPMKNGRGSAAGHRLVKLLGTVGKKLGVQAIIYDRTIWSAKSPGGRRYTGAHPHYDHIHVELTRSAASNLTKATIRGLLNPSSGSKYGPFKNTKPGTRTIGQFKTRAWSAGSDVKDLQSVLNAWYPKLSKLKVDGYFGPATSSRVRHLQKAASLKVDGIVGTRTWDRIGY
jgi:hypothetical protein